jgi:hypothetical protein
MNRLPMTAEQLDAYRSQILDIKKFKKDGFKQVCDVDSPLGVGWNYKNIDTSLMFSEHNSWVYMIVLDNIVVKVGETGNPLGISEYYVYGNSEAQPRSGSKSRLGRLRKGDSTDAYIREHLRPYIKNGYTVSIWAKKCPIRMLTESISGNEWNVQTQIHKSLELAYLTYFQNKLGQLPMLNKAHK